MSWSQVSRIFHFLQILDYDIFTNRVFAKIIMNLPYALRCKTFKYLLVSDGRRPFRPRLKRQIIKFDDQLVDDWTFEIGSKWPSAT